MSKPNFIEEIKSIAVRMLKKISQIPSKHVPLQVSKTCPKLTDFRILEETQLHSYYLQKVHALLPKDFPQRVESLNWVLDKPTSVLFIDENGVINSHEMRLDKNSSTSIVNIFSASLNILPCDRNHRVTYN